MKTRVVYISGGDLFDPADIKRALDDVRTSLRLPSDIILFGIPIDNLAQPAPAAEITEPEPAPAPSAPKSILGGLRPATEPVAAAEPKPEPTPAPICTKTADFTDADLEDILGDIAPLEITDMPAAPAPTPADEEFPESVKDLAREMADLNPEDFKQIEETIWSKAGKGLESLRNVIPFGPKNKKSRGKQPDLSGPNLFDFEWNTGAPANDSKDDFDLPPALKGLI